MTSESKFSPNLIFQPFAASDIPEAFAIETEGYPADEAASLEVFIQRQSQAPDLFLGAYIDDQPRKLVGYVCATASSASTLTHESMSKHDPNGSSVCIHSVCVASVFRHQGIATRLLKEYISHVNRIANDNGSSKSRKYERIHLIAHEELRPLYEGAGFEWVGPSAVVHGSRPWFEMSKVLTDEPSNAPSGSLTTTTVSQADEVPPPGAITQEHIMQALQASFASSSRRPRPTAHLLPQEASKEDILNLTQDDDENGSSSKVNKYDLLCPQPGCGCIILKSGVGRLVEQDASNIPEIPSPQTQAPAPLTSTNVSCWLIEPSPMAFENVGFSKSVERATGGPKTKFLICADCDHGPLGWTFEGETRFWVFCNRVGYKI